YRRPPGPASPPNFRYPRSLFCQIGMRFPSQVAMAKWFKEFPINLKNGADRIRSASESGSQPKATKTGPVASIGTKTAGSKTGHRKNTSGDHTNRKNSELSRNGTISLKDGKVWENFLSGKSRKNSKAEPAVEEPHRPLKSSQSANGFINRLIRVDKQDKTPNFNSATITNHQVAPEAEKPAQCKSEAVSVRSKRVLIQVIILEDYADPFDAQKTREQREAERVGENDGYMEPYDAQQMITEIRRRGSKDLLKVCVEAGEGTGEDGQPVPLQIYDVPYKGGGEGDKAAVTPPERDSRPPTEYELLWEWRKEPVIKTLSVEFISSLVSPPAQFDSPEHQTKAPAPSCALDAEARCVDPCLPLEKQSWYHGCVTRQEAEFLLQPCREASFLVRNSESDSSKYSIALKTSQGCVHIIVAQTKENGYTLDQSSCVFANIPEVVHHYCSRRLPFDGAEHMTLLHPVPRPH
uniref:SH2 domain-containing adapter protein E n=1 Tax=Gasterosteus aculeatus TaxID=69293 RepID=G3NKR1_GASAC